MKKLKCEQCKRTIRSNNKKRIFLFLRPGDVEVYVCGPRCFNKYNEGEDLKGEPDEGGLH